MNSSVRTVSASADINVELLQQSSQEGLESPDKSDLEKTTLLRKLDEKQRDIDRLHVIIEAMSPIPGLDYDKMKRLMIEKGDEIDIDHRDSKIVSLAKKCRNLTVQVNKLSAENENLQQAVRESNQLCNHLREEIALTRNNNNINNNSTKLSRCLVPDATELAKELAGANKSIEELRRKYLQAKEESKNLRAALTRELGEGVTIEQALDGNWRGRAQTIIMLKSKIKRLETQGMSSKSEMGTLASSNSNGISNCSSSNSRDVDAKAERTLADMDSDRKHMIESITEDYKRLDAENSELETKYASAKARIKNLEYDNQKIKQQIQIILDKTSCDDELIDALKSEVEHLKQTIRDNHRTNDSSKTNGDNRKNLSLQSTRISGSSDHDETLRRLTSEITRLERICKSQVQQLSTQDGVIRELRNELSR